MIILTIRTDKPEAEVGLYKDEQQLGYATWEAHRALTKTIHNQIKTLLSQQKLTWDDMGGIVVYRGPGSFTGLRIGISCANAMAYSLGTPIVGTQERWIETGLERLRAGENDQTVIPEYGSPVFTTSPKK